MIFKESIISNHFLLLFSCQCRLRCRIIHPTILRHRCLPMIHSTSTLTLYSSCNSIPTMTTHCSIKKTTDCPIYPLRPKSTSQLPVAWISSICNLLTRILNFPLHLSLTLCFSSNIWSKNSLLSYCWKCLARKASDTLRLAQCSRTATFL